MDERDYIDLNKDVVKITPTELLLEQQKETIRNMTFETIEDELAWYKAALNRQLNFTDVVEYKLEKENKELRQQIFNLTKSETK